MHTYWPAIEACVQIQPGAGGDLYHRFVHL